MSEVPFVAFGNEELADADELKIGDEIVCPHCGENHTVDGGKDMETGEVSDILLFYKCGLTSFLAGVGGKNVMRRFSK